MNRRWLAACLIAAMVGLAGCGSPSGIREEGPDAAAGVETGTAAAGDREPADVGTDTGDVGANRETAEPAGGSAATPTASAGTKPPDASPASGSADAADGSGTVTSSASASASPGVTPAASDAGVPEPIESGGAEIIVRSENALSSAEKEALLKELESELDSLFDAIDKIDASTKEALGDESVQ